MSAPSVRKRKQPALFFSDPSGEEYDNAGAVNIVGDSDGADNALVGNDREATMKSTLRSSAGTQVCEEAACGTGGS